MLQTTFNVLEQQYGPQNWWPAESRLEIILGAILTQGTTWKNAAKAIANLRQQSILAIKELSEIPQDRLACLLKPSGYFNAKAKTIKAFIGFVQAYYRGDLNLLLNQSTDLLRRNLLSIHGIGQETADDILLYAAERPIFVIDNYTRRIVYRLGLAPDSNQYRAYQNLFHQNLNNDSGLFNQYHALLVRHAQETCRSKPECPDCCLNSVCPTGLNRHA